MLNAQPNPKLFKRFTLTWVLILPLLFYAFFVGGKQWLSANLYETSHRTLSLYVSGLKEILNKYKALPEIYADHPLMLALLEAPDDVRLRHKSNMLLEKFNAVSGASATYVLNAQGITLAASNWNLPKSFVGRSFSFRPYFQNALASGRGRFFALGTTSLQRGYYMSSAIQNAQGETKGVMVVKVDVTKVEKEWNAPNSEVLVTDDASIVFLASRPKWLYNAFKDPSPKALVELGQTRRYADKTIGRLPFTIEEAQLPWSNRFNAVNKGDKSYLVTHLDIPSAGWQVWILANYTVMINTAFAYAVGAVLLISLV
ncbi:MAG: hypothetical protein JKY92_09315, partial [Magnetovibrio sp.]|nr:hypothetical protein [Magnetovibrio sp.]